jgi:chromosome segregation ATPase
MNELEKTSTLIESLKMSYQEKKNKIRDNKQQIEILEGELSTIQEKIVDNCSHQWAYESPAIYERGYYYCSICGKTK